MRVERITDKQGICLITIFIIGSSILIGTGGEAGNDAWLAGLTGLFMSLPAILVYARISSLFPGKNLYEILRIVFGGFAGRGLMALYTFYSFHLGALVLRNFGEFIRSAVMTDSPLMFSVLAATLVCILVCRSGIEVLGRGAVYALPLLFAITGTVMILGISQYDLAHLQPVMGGGLIRILKGGFMAFSFPYAETLLFLGSFCLLKDKRSPFRIYLGGIAIGGIVITLVTLMNSLVLGEMYSLTSFPSYTALSIISVGWFAERFEIAVSFTYFTGIFIKGSICLTSACKGLSEMFELNSYRSAIVPMGLLMAWFSYDLYTNTAKMHIWANYAYHWYALPFQVIIPLILWITAEIRLRRGLKV